MPAEYKLPRIALIGKGVRFPNGQWVRLLTGDLVPPSLVQELAADLFPALRYALVPVVTLLTDFDVDEIEPELEGIPTTPSG